MCSKAETRTLEKHKCCEKSDGDFSWHFELNTASQISKLFNFFVDMVSVGNTNLVFFASMYKVRKNFDMNKIVTQLSYAPGLRRRIGEPSWRFGFRRRTEKLEEPEKKEKENNKNACNALFFRNTNSYPASDTKKGKLLRHWSWEKIKKKILKFCKPKNGKLCEIESVAVGKKEKPKKPRPVCNVRVYA